MRIKSFGLAFLAFLICAVVSAQSYSIRVTSNTNLRASYSLESRPVETVPAGTTLQVVGSFNRWLKINRSGGDAWMASWVSHSRVEDQTVSVDTGSADIDNCCFVDRQCQTDLEWQAGYWAFQNHECSAPTQALSPVSTPASGIAFEGPDSFVAQVHRALDLLQARAPNWYDYVTSGLSKIRVTTDAAYSGVNSSTGVWEMPPHRADRPPASWISSLAHEACHVHHHRSGQGGDDLTEERACVTAGRDAVQAANPPGAQGFIAWLNNLLATIDRPECQWWHDPANYHFPEDC
ncbi:MAG: SH3 domain-containing protein [Chloroflexi bacterium]|nr:SH3 domain-containing protein [Chloroflexota bacterium]